MLLKVILFSACSPPPALLRLLSEVYWKNADNSEVAGYQGYGSSQFDADDNDVDKAQRKHVLSLLPWTDWRDCFPNLALQGWTSSSQWADAFEKAILGKLKSKFKEKGVMWPVLRGEDIYQILYVHLLDQSHAAARFRWHRDTEEDTPSMRVVYSLVVLLLKDGKVAGMKVANAQKPCKYSSVGTGFIFDSSLFHSTEEVDDCSCLKVGVFVGYVNQTS